MRGVLAEHLVEFIDKTNVLIAQAKRDGIVPTPELARARLSALSAFVSHIPDVAFFSDNTIVANGQTIPVKVYSPAPRDSLPLVVFYHGGGHMCGDIALYDPMCRKIALAGHCIVVAVEYRLAPEFPYPCGLDDAELALRNVEQVLTAVKHNGQVIIAGDSAGGAICSSLVMRQVNDPSLRIDKQILIYPSVDYTMSHASIDENGQGFFLEKARIAWYFDHYFEQKEDAISASPLLNPVSATSPDTLFIIAGCDPLRDEGLAYANKLQQAGVSVMVQQFNHMIHAFMNIEDLVPKECATLYRTIGTFIKGSN